MRNDAVMELEDIQELRPFIQKQGAIGEASSRQMWEMKGGRHIRNIQKAPKFQSGNRKGYKAKAVARTNSLSPPPPTNSPTPTRGAPWQTGYCNMQDGCAELGGRTEHPRSNKEMQSKRGGGRRLPKFACTRSATHNIHKPRSVPRAVRG